MSLEFAPQVSLRRTSTGLVMLFDQAEGIMYELNDTASDIAVFLAQSGPCTVAQVLDRMLREYDSADGQVEADLNALLDDFTERGLIQGNQQPPA